jgi:hypothetical protein
MGLGGDGVAWFEDAAEEEGAAMKSMYEEL